MKTTKMLSRGLSVLAVTALGAAVLTGCAGSGEPGEVTLQMVESLSSPTRTEQLRGLLDGFEQSHAGIKVELITPPSETADGKIQQMLQAGAGVDLLEVRDVTVGQFSTNGWLYDMSADLNGWDGWDDLTETARAYSTTVDGATYFIPYGFYGLTLFYRTDLIAEAGFDGPPASWSELIEQASAIQDPDSSRYGFAFRGGKSGYTQLILSILAYVGDDLDPENAFQTKDGEVIFSTPEARSALRDYLELFTEAGPPSSIAWGYPEMVEGFNNGSTAFLLQDPEVIQTISESSVLTADQWDTAPLPVGPGGKAARWTATAGWGIAESSEHKEEAVELIEYLSSGDAAVSFTKENSMVPNVTSAAEDDFYKTGPWVSYLTMNSDPETYLPVVVPEGVPWWSEFATTADADLQEVLIGKLGSQELLDKWAAYWDEKWAG